MAVAITVFTRDLRVHDNPVLSAAVAGADQVIPLFVLDQHMLDSGFVSPNRAAFLAESLANLDRRLHRLGAGLVVRRGTVADVVADLVAEHGVGDVHVAADVTGYAQRREEALRSRLSDSGAALHVHDAVTTVVPPGAVTPSGGGDHFAVFTPYLRHWTCAERRSVLPPPARVATPRVSGDPMPRADDLGPGPRAPSLPPGGETAAREGMTAWGGASVRHYGRLQDDLAADGTSRLSPYLHFGCLSPTELVASVGRGSDGAEAFVRQVAWRDFHHQVLAARPACSQADYRSRGDRWRTSDEDFDCWRRGRTGYPVVDAGMRQLEQEGWMHNRARLIVASFLTKTLYVDWRWGARHFMDMLVDGDIANNQMNWQWVAGTGTDTRPQRVLNPLAQALRYDPTGEYVRQYVPELADVPGAAVHRPWTLPAEQRKQLDYPEPMVDLDEGRDRFLRARGKR
ncbi:MAG TPA: deoxyribodipyrimidine photo-lyase [Nocardioidaceae bacterium]|nr:deoxyribodipyrimidine photo-lyase [Nocardioidaceae bacterium]